MPDIASILQSGTANPWLYLPLAALLGALHALEPGHSKSMMAAFIIAVKGTTAEAVLLGVSAAVGHTIIVWIIALLGLYLGDRLIVEKAEPWLLLISGLIVMALAVRLFWILHDGERHDHDHDHDHDSGHGHVHGETHAQAHDRQIRERFAGTATVTRRDIVWFGFTSGLLPCPAAITVLLVCLQLKAFTLGLGMVASFSVGLACTLVGVGVLAAWGAHSATTRWNVAEKWSHRLPFLSAALVFAIGVWMAAHGIAILSRA